MQLPVFNGEIGQWKEFWQQFRIATDTKPIDKVYKLAYLKSCLRGNSSSKLLLRKTAPQKLKINAAGDLHYFCKSKQVTVQLQTKEGPYPLKAKTIDKLMGNVWNVQLNNNEARQSYSRNRTVLDLKKCLRQKPQVLIGGDVLHKIVNYRSAKSLNSGHVIPQSKVGPLISGSGPVQGVKINAFNNESAINMAGHFITETTLMVLQSPKKDL